MWHYRRAMSRAHRSPPHAHGGDAHDAREAASNPFSSIPPVNRLVDELADLELPHRLCVDVVRRELDLVRAADPIPERAVIEARVRTAAVRLAASRLRPTINATGVLLHTNLGRAPLGDAAAALAMATGGYSNLELDLVSGTRGSRGRYVERALAALCEAEAATVVNNCAAALLLAVSAATGGGPRREVIVSRGELIQIGGGFRIPDVLTAAGARLREVGTTNQTTCADFAAACGESTAALLTVHHSNFVMEGFVAAPRLAELREVAASAGVPLIADLGSGAVTRTDDVAELPREPRPQEILAGGATLVCFSGDKLLGGPQAGVIAGDAAWIARLKAHPLFRALRLDKVALALLQHTVDLHLSGSAGIPLQAMLHTPVAALQERAEALVRGLPAALGATAAGCTSRLGGGTLPTATLPSAGIAIALPGGSADAFAAALRRTTPPVIGHIHRDRIVLDLRTVPPHQDESLATAIASAAGTLSAPQ
jgi:L-seryl-tRNA(Ser) seleniumtransferase